MSGWLLPVLVDALRQRRAAGKRIPLACPRKRRSWHYPWAIEQSYAQWITRTLRKMMGALDISHFDDWVKSYHGDAENFSDGWENSLDRLRKAQKSLFDGEELEQTYAAIFSYASQTNKFNQTQWANFVSDLLGTTYYPPDAPQVTEALKVWTTRNFELIRSLSEQEIAKVNHVIHESVLQGISYKDVMADLRIIDQHMSVNRAKLIARDQVGKLNGELAKDRQLDAGVDAYEWQTAGDERVRGNPYGPFKRAIPSHYIMDHKICSWKDATVILDMGHWIPRESRMPSSHPGQDIQCRCVGIPYMGGIWAEALKEFRK